MPMLRLASASFWCLVPGALRCGQSGLGIGEGLRLLRRRLLAGVVGGVDRGLSGVYRGLGVCDVAHSDIPLFRNGVVVPLCPAGAIGKLALDKSASGEA